MTRSLIASLATLFVLSGTVAIAAEAKAPVLYSNCAHLNAKYPHGVGRYGAKDKTSGDPVTNFKHSTLLYNTAMRWNRGLDRDKDGIACEKSD